MSTRGHDGRHTDLGTGPCFEGGEAPQPADARLAAAGAPARFLGRDSADARASSRPGARTKGRPTTLSRLPGSCCGSPPAQPNMRGQLRSTWHDSPCASLPGPCWCTRRARGGGGRHHKKGASSSALCSRQDRALGFATLRARSRVPPRANCVRAPRVRNLQRGRGLVLLLLAGVTGESTVVLLQDRVLLGQRGLLLHRGRVHRVGGAHGAVHVAEVAIGVGRGQALAAGRAQERGRPCHQAQRQSALDSPRHRPRLVLRAHDAPRGTRRGIKA